MISNWYCHTSFDHVYRGIYHGIRSRGSFWVVTRVQIVFIPGVWIIPVHTVHVLFTVRVAAFDSFGRVYVFLNVRVTALVWVRGVCV